MTNTHNNSLISPITKASPEVYAQAVARAARGGDVWPFRTMQVGEEVVIKERLSQAKAALRNIGRVWGPHPEFITRTDPDTDWLYVTRVI